VGGAFAPPLTLRNKTSLYRVHLFPPSHTQSGEIIGKAKWPKHLFHTLTAMKKRLSDSITVELHGNEAAGSQRPGADTK
jgi:hypothetical protein